MTLSALPRLGTLGALGVLGGGGIGRASLGNLSTFAPGIVPDNRCGRLAWPVAGIPPRLRELRSGEARCLLAGFPLRDFAVVARGQFRSGKGCCLLAGRARFGRLFVFLDDYIL